MILSRTLFPTEQICPVGEMYFKGTGYTLMPDGSITFIPGGRLSTSTYFNSFSLEKWVKYTVIENLTLSLRLAGEFELSLYMMSECDGVVTRECVLREDIRLDSESAYTVQCSLEGEGVLYFELLAKSEDARFFGHEYKTDIDEAMINPVELAIGICTFRREEYVIANLKRLDEAIKNPASPLYSHAHVYVSDNGSTLDIEALTTENVSVVYNKNYGGAGGFTRTLIESLRSGKSYTNFIFMDDDIVLDVSAVERNFILLSLLKEEHRESVIGGAMFSTDSRSLQFENGAKWDRIGFNFHLRDVDLCRDINIVLNEQDRDVNYNAWCYCCVPYSVVRENNLPLPIFFHMDDVEFGLRNKRPVLSMNGINVWHLYKKGLINPKNDYYDVRNRLIMLAELQPRMVSALAHVYLSSFTFEIFKYHYARAINAFDGILDFCRGFDYFKSLDTSKKHASLYSNVKWVKADDWVRRRAMTSLKDGYGKKFKFKSLLKFLFKPKRRMTVVYNDNGVNDALKAKSVCVYNCQDDMCATYKHNLLLFIKCAFKYLKAKRAIKRRLAWATEDFGNNIAQVQNIDFWNKYLGLSELKYDKKVLFVASDNDKTSGAFRSMAVLASILRDRHNVRPVVMLPKRGDGESFLSELDISYVTIPSEDWIVMLDDSERTVTAKKRSMSRANKKAKALYKRYLKKNEFDVIHINTSYHYAIADVANKLGIPLVWHLREFLEEDQKRRFVNKRKAYELIKKSDRVIAISDSIKAKYESAFADKLVRIYNGVSVETYLNEEKTVFDSEKTTFVCTGAMVEYKGQHLLLEACGKLKQAGVLDNFEILFAGNNKGPYMQTIESLIRQYGLAEHVQILGRQNHVEKLYNKSDIMFVGSRSEAFGRITVEAMLSGCLLIGANTSGTAEIVTDGVTGLLFEHGDTDALAEKIKYALEHKNEMKAIADKGRAYAKETYPADKNADYVYGLYCELLEGGRK